MKRTFIKTLLAGESARLGETAGRLVEIMVTAAR